MLTTNTDFIQIWLSYITDAEKTLLRSIGFLTPSGEIAPPITPPHTPTGEPSPSSSPVDASDMKTPEQPDHNLRAFMTAAASPPTKNPIEPSKISAFIAELLRILRERNPCARISRLYTHLQTTFANPQTDSTLARVIDILFDALNFALFQAPHPQMQTSHSIIQNQLSTTTPSKAERPKSNDSNEIRLVPLVEDQNTLPNYVSIKRKDMSSSLARAAQALNWCRLELQTILSIKDHQLIPADILHNRAERIRCQLQACQMMLEPPKSVFFEWFHFKRRRCRKLLQNMQHRLYQGLCGETATLPGAIVAVVKTSDSNIPLKQLNKLTEKLVSLCCSRTGRVPLPALRKAIRQYSGLPKEKHALLIETLGLNKTADVSIEAFMQRFKDQKLTGTQTQSSLFETLQQALALQQATQGPPPTPQPTVAPPTFPPGRCAIDTPLPIAAAATVKTAALPANGALAIPVPF